MDVKKVNPYKLPKNRASNEAIKEEILYCDTKFKDYYHKEDGKNIKRNNVKKTPIENTDNNNNCDYTEDNLESNVFSFWEQQVEKTNIMKFLDKVPEKSHGHSLVSEIFSCQGTSLDLPGLLNTINAAKLSEIEAKDIQRTLSDEEIKSLYLSEINFTRIWKYEYFMQSKAMNDNKSALSDQSPRKRGDKDRDKGKAKVSLFKFVNLLTFDDYYNFLMLSVILKYADASSEFPFEAAKPPKEYPPSKFKDFSIKLFYTQLDQNYSKEPPNEETFKKCLLNHKERLNLNNWYLVHFLNHAHDFPIDTEEKIYFSWKRLFGLMEAKWDLMEKSGIVIKYPMKYLKVKTIIKKLVRSKESGKFLSTAHGDQKEDLSIKKIFSMVTEGMGHDYPRLVLLANSTISIIFDFIIDFSVIYFIAILPMVLVLNLSSQLINFLNEFFNGLYLFNILRFFRTLAPGDLNKENKSIKIPFFTQIKDPEMYMDAISLLPFDLLYAIGNPDERSNNYVYMKFFYILRVARFGRSFKFMEMTKYGSVFKLIKVMGLYIGLIHWIGIYILKTFEADLYLPKWERETPCATYSSTNPVTLECLYLDAIYSGSYSVPGRPFNNIAIFDTFRTDISTYFFLFFVFFLGQIITAYVFSGVSDVIRSMNQAEDDFQEIRDTHRITGLFYEINTEVFTDIQTYYEYIWLKHREKIYGMNIFDGLSLQLKKKVTEAMIVSHQYLLKDFISVSKEGSQIIEVIFNHLEKYIAFPYERLTIQGHVIRGLFFLDNGTVYFEDEPRVNEKKTRFELEEIKGQHEIRVKEKTLRKSPLRKDLKGEITLSPELLKLKLLAIKKHDFDKYLHDKIMFPLDSIFIKTARAIETYYTTYFCDLFFLPVDFFDNTLINNYPYEMHQLQKIAKMDGMKKLGNDSELLSVILAHSSRSVGMYYEPEFSTENMWIEIKRVLPKYKLGGISKMNKIDIMSNKSNNFGIFDIGLDSLRRIEELIAFKTEIIDEKNLMKGLIIK